MSRLVGLAALTAVALGGAIGAFGLLTRDADKRPVWIETQWPFAKDPWGRGRAFACSAADCGAEIGLYVRPKLGACNCMTGIANDDDLDRMGDLALVGAEVSPLGTGRPVAVGWMQGRARAYALTARDAPGRSVLSVAFNDRCDMVVATVVLPHDRPAAIEADVTAFLSSAPMLEWVRVTLGI